MSDMQAAIDFCWVASVDCQPTCYLSALVLCYPSCRASGTSMAAPHVAGLIAVYLEAHPDATPAQVQDALTAASTDGVLQSDLMLPDTPNRLLYSMDFEDQQVPVKATDSAQKGS